MSVTKKPSMAALDQLIDSFSGKLAALKKEQEQVIADSQSIPENTKETELSDFIANSPIKTYNQIEDTLKSALELLDTANLFATSTPDPETFASIASLISSIQGLFTEFTDIWKKQINYQNAVNMENLRFQNKKALEDHKYELKLKFHNQTTALDADGNNLKPKNVAFNTLDIINQLKSSNKDVIDVDSDILNNQ